MRKIKVTIEHNGATLYGQIAKIHRTSLGLQDHGIMTAWLHCKWDGGGVGVGGYALDQPKKDLKGKHLGRFGSDYGLDYIMRVLETAGVEEWEKLPGTEIIILFKEENSWGSSAVGFASLLDDKVLIFVDHALLWKDES